MINSKKFNNILIISIIGTIFLMSMGYSVKNKELMISGELIYRNQNDIRITDVTLANAPTNVEVLYSDYSKKEINIGYKSLEGTNESNQAIVTLKIEVTNFTDTEMGILKIENLPENATIEGYTLKEKLSNSNGILKVGMATTFNITLKSSSVETKELILNFDFEPFVSVTYQGFKNTTGFKTDTLKGDNFSQNIGSGFEICSVTMNGKATSNYNFSNGVITISNVTGDIVIDVYIASEREEPTIPNNPELNGEMIPVYYDEAKAVWKKADVNNIDNDWYDYNTQKWANAVTIVQNGIKEKLVGSENVNIINELSLTNYKSTNQLKENTTSNLTLNFTAGNSGGTLSFDYKVSSEKKDQLTLKVIIDDNEPEVPVNAVGEIQSGNYTKELSPNAKVTIVADYKKNYIKNKNDDTAYISNLSVPEGSTAISNNSTGDYPWVQERKYYVGTKYEIDKEEKFVLLKTNDHDFNAEDIGKYMCPDGSTTCTELYEITSVVGNAIKSVNKYSIEDVSRQYYKDAEKDTVIPIWNINTMWVWVPRYSYTIKSEDGTNYYGKRSYCTIPSKATPGEIDVKFITTDQNDTTGSAQYTGSNPTNWRTNEAFNFDGAKAGIWVGKFEPTGSYTETCTDESCNVSGVTIVPNKVSIMNKTVSDFFYMARSMQLHNADTYGFNVNSGDLHLMKNDEWGAVAYLSQSRYGKYGNEDYTGPNKEIYINYGYDYITGNSVGSPETLYLPDEPNYEYDDMTNLGSGKGQVGPGASTTGTIYGVYDMSGGAAEYVMGVLEYDSQTKSEHPGEIVTGGQFAESGFKGLNYRGDTIGTIDLPNKKYYNTYKSADPGTIYEEEAKSEKACDGGVCYGHALSETILWYYDDAYFPSRGASWFVRSHSFQPDGAGVFSVGYNTNGVPNSCRLVLI